jgi:phospholipid/cholesterol/gamma-HCH transport system substrate-binding protein
METRANYVAIGAFVLAMLAGLVVAVLWLARVDFDREIAKYDIFFDGSVSGLSQGATVLYNGIQIGRVVEIRVNPQNLQQVRVTIEVNQVALIKTDAVASLETQGLTGVALIEISGGRPDAEPLTRKDGERYPVIASRLSGLQQFVTSAPEVLARINLLADNLSKLVDEKNRAAIAETLDNIRRLSAAAATRTEDIDATIGDAAAAMHDLRATMATANQTLLDLRHILAEGGEARDALNAIDQTARKLDQLATHVDGLIQENRPQLRDFSQNGLNQASQLLVDTRALIAGLNRVVEQIQRDPARFFFGGDRREGYQPR